MTNHHLSEDIPVIVEVPPNPVTQLVNGSNISTMVGSPGNEMLVWVDVETTGLTPVDCSLLEVAAIITDLSGNVVSDDFNEVVFYDEIAARELREGSIPFVQSMHDKTDLWGKLPSGVPIADLDKKFHAFIKQHIPVEKKGRLAGNSVRLDLNFLETFLPVTYSHLHYRSVDVSALAYALDAWGIVNGWFVKEKNHDALGDIRESLNEYKWLREIVLKEMELADSTRMLLGLN